MQLDPLGKRGIDSVLGHHSGLSGLWLSKASPSSPQQRCILFWIGTKSVWSVSTAKYQVKRRWLHCFTFVGWRRYFAPSILKYL